MDYVGIAGVMALSMAFLLVEPLAMLVKAGARLASVGTRRPINAAPLIRRLPSITLLSLGIVAIVGGFYGLLRPEAKGHPIVFTLIATWALITWARRQR